MVVDVLNEVPVRELARREGVPLVLTAKGHLDPRRLQDRQHLEAIAPVTSVQGKRERTARRVLQEVGETDRCAYWNADKHRSNRNI